MTDPVRIKDVLESVGDRLGFKGATQSAFVWRKWPELAGAAVAEHSEPTSLRDGVLRIRTDSPTWATEIAYLGADIVRRANAAAGREIAHEVRVWTSPAPIRPRRPPRTRDARARPVPTDDVPVDPETALGAAREAWARRLRGGAR
jgi:predicted nucleic acid-binding Zn ribbon protein